VKDAVGEFRRGCGQQPPGRVGKAREGRGEVRFRLLVDRRRLVKEAESCLRHLAPHADTPTTMPPQLPGGLRRSVAAHGGR
jgi:hypothetical protein